MRNRLTAAIVAAVVFTLGPTGIAAAAEPNAPASTGGQAQAAPGFLTGEQMRPLPGERAWSAGDIRRHRPGTAIAGPGGCLGLDHPDNHYGDAEVWYREFLASFDGYAAQVSVRTASKASAKRLVQRLEQAVAQCAATELATNAADGTASWRAHRPIAVGDGARVYSLRVEQSVGLGHELYGIGRDGEIVTVVFAPYPSGRKPVKQLAETMVVAVEKLR